MENLWSTQSVAAAPSSRVAGMHQHIEKPVGHCGPVAAT